MSKKQIQKDKIVKNYQIICQILILFLNLKE